MTTVSFNINNTGYGLFSNGSAVLNTCTIYNPIVISYAPSALTSTSNIGYSSTSSLNTATSNNTTTNLCSKELTAGVWLVEGQVTTNMTNAGAYYACSLSSTSATLDTSRTQFVWMNDIVNGNFPCHITSVFTLTSTTTIYLVFQNPNSILSAQNQTITATRIA
jgi:hypothetical protein